MSEKARVDVIIPAYRPGDKFTALVRGLRSQSYPYHKLIVVNTNDDSTGDGGRASAGGAAKSAAEAGASGMSPEIRGLLNEDDRTLLIDIPKSEFNHAATRNYAASLSDSEYFICMTDDAVPADDRLIEQLMLPFSDTGIAISCARQIAFPESSEAEKYFRSFNYPAESRERSIADLGELGVKTYFVSNVCAAYRRDVFEILGGFVARADFNEDMLYAAKALKAGYRSYYNAEAKVFHSHDYTAAQQYRRNFEIGKSQAEHPEVFSGLSSEGEGLRLVKGSLKHLVSSGHALEIPGFIVRTGCRYLGYRAGKRAARR